MTRTSGDMGAVRLLVDFLRAERERLGHDLAFIPQEQQ